MNINGSEISQVQTLFFNFPRDYSVPPILQTLEPRDIAKVITLGVTAYETVLTSGQKLSNEETFKLLRHQASQQFEKDANDLRKMNTDLTNLLETLKMKLSAEQEFRADTERRIREEERRNREELIREKDLRITALEQTLKSQLQTIDSNFRESSRSLTEGFQTFKQQILRTSTGSKTKGSSGEAILTDLLRKSFGSVGSDEHFEINGIGEQGYSGDIIMEWKNSKLMWEAKNYSSNVDKKEVDKFKRDMELNKEYLIGVLVSMETGIVGHTKAGDIDIELLPDGRPLLYLSNLNRHDDAVYYFQSLRPLLEVLLTRAKQYFTQSVSDMQVEDELKARNLKELEDKISVILILARNHQTTVTKFKNLMNVHKKKHEQMWLELLTELREAENQVKLMMESLLGGNSSATLTSISNGLPLFIFRSETLSSFSEREQKFITDCMNLFTFNESQNMKAVDVKSCLGKLGWSEDQITLMRERVFQENVWIKGRKDVNFFGLKPTA